jgi:selenide,water dikinase
MSELAQVLRHVPMPGDPRILVDAASRDDAAVWQLSPDRALVATVDFFTPVVDDAATWGRIAAANALSDLYAMGATPLFGLNLVGWPRDTLPFELLGEVLGGIGEVAAAAGCPIVGGHSVDALEPHVGMVALGEAHPDRLLTNAGARPGDLLVLTKPLGTGILATALKRERITEAEMARAVQSMTALNLGAMRAALDAGVRAATDITGFGLLGHLGNVLTGSQAGARIWLDQVPQFDAVLTLAREGFVSGGSKRNLEAAGAVAWAENITPEERILLADAQTSGGLLLAVPPDAVDRLLAGLAREGTLTRAVIGEITGQPGQVTVSRSR